MKMGKRAAIALIGLLLPIAAVQAQQGEDFRETAKNSIKEHTKDGTPFRKAHKLKLKERKQGGKPTPEQDPVYFEPSLEEIENGKGWGPGDCEEKKRCEIDGYVVKYSAVTQLKYRGPHEVLDEPGNGKKARWPEHKIKKKTQSASGEWVQVYNEDGTEAYEDFTELYKKAAQLELLGDPEAGAAPLWKVNPDDPDDPGLWEYGLEPLDEWITEEITFTFPQDDQAQGKAFFRQLSAALDAGTLTPEKAILMGFTYQGPYLDYAVGSTKQACLWGKCVTAWDIKAGFELDFAVGLRAPAYSRISGPAQMIAGNTYAFSSVIETGGTSGDWDPPAFAAEAVNAYAGRGATGEADGNEFVMYFDFFAGAKVKIAGVNVCPYCKYVEVNKDYSTSYATPFGPGTSFPLPGVDVPIIQVDYDIVALEAGLTVTPTVTSSNISAVVSTGGEISHTAPGTPTTFDWRACIEREGRGPHSKTISLDQYKYHFTNFGVDIGGYLDFSVGGYGAWHPQYDFLTLDLSRSLGTLGAYLPDHKNCNKFFQCTQAPAVQGVAMTSQILDQSAPTPTLTLGGTEGLRSWWKSNVGGTLSAVDNPVGCGAGVQATFWSLDGGPAQIASTFELSREGRMVVGFGATDNDDNAESLARDVWIDKTPPTITGAPTTIPNLRGWYNHDVVVHFVPADATSGVYASTADTTLRAEARDQWVEGIVEDAAGWTSSVVVGGINIDKTAPDIQIQLPTPDGDYRGDTSYTLAWTITDLLSGELSHGSTLDGRTTAPPTDLNHTPIVSGSTLDFGHLSGGEHELLVTATDNADNTATKSVKFVVDVDIDGLIHATELMCNGGQLSRGACKSLMMKAQQAKRALDAENKNAARGVLLGYKQELLALRGKGVKEDAFQLLYADVQYVLRREGLIGSA